MTLRDRIGGGMGEPEAHVFCKRPGGTANADSDLLGQIRDRGLDVPAAQLAEVPADHVFVVRDGDVAASSSLEDLRDAIHLANNELFARTTGTLEKRDLPAVVRELEDETFTFDATTRETLPFVLISRVVEFSASDYDAGKLRSGFQKLSRLRDERGTAQVYRRIGTSDLDVHVYGVPDWVPPTDIGVTVHAAHSAAFRDHWFTVFRAPPSSNDAGSGFLAVEQDPNEWIGTWSTRPAFVEDLCRYLRRNM